MRSISKILVTFFMAVIIAVPTTLAVAAPAAADTRTFGHLQSNAHNFTKGKDTHLHMRVRVSGRFPGTARIFVGTRAIASHRLDDGVARFTIRRSQLPDNKRTKVTIKVNPDPRGRANTAVWTRVTDKKKSAGQKIVSAARAQVGDNYRLGATGMNTWDCSSLTRHAVKKATGKQLPRTSGAQSKKGHRVSRSHARPGDLVYVKGHIAVYAGNGRVIEAATPRTGVVERKMWQRGAKFIRITG